MRDKYVFFIGFGVGLVFTSLIAFFLYNLYLDKAPINIEKEEITTSEQSYQPQSQEQLETTTVTNNNENSTTNNNSNNISKNLINVTIEEKTETTTYIKQVSIQTPTTLKNLNSLNTTMLLEDSNINKIKVFTKKSIVNQE